MRERKDKQAGKQSMSRRHPVRQQVMAVLLGVCLTAVSIPVSQFGYSVEAAELQEEQQDTVRFSNLFERFGGRLEAGGRRNSPDDAVTSDDGTDSRQEKIKELQWEKLMKEETRPLAEAETEILFAEEEPEQSETPTEPGCGIVSEDITWESAGVLANGELVVMPGVTLTIKGGLRIDGTVTIKGGGTIVRGSTAGGFSMSSYASLTLEDITLDGCADSFSEPAVPMITVLGNNNLTLESSCTIRNCRALRGGAIYGQYSNRNNVVLNGALIENCSSSDSTGGGGGIYLCEANNSKIILNNATIRGCSAGDKGGGVYASCTDVTINGGHYEDNRTVGLGYSGGIGINGGGFIFTCRGTLTINDGIFTDNASATKGGCIHHCGHTGTYTIIRGGTFSGNTCSGEGYEGSGALYNSTMEVGDTSVTLSGDVKFAGNTDDSGTDGIYLDAKDQTLRKIQISDTLTYPVKLFLKPIEGYVIAQGVNNYQLLRRRDMKKISFVDVSDSGKTWYAVLDEKKNQVYMSETDPGYGYFVYYVKNGAKGEAVTDEHEYGLQEEVTVKSGNGLSYEGRQYVGWNTEADGSGIMYQEGDKFTLEGDTDLYAIFKAPFIADFYSGSAGNKDSIAAVMDWEQMNGTVMTPELKPLEGYAAVGWDEDPDGFDGETEEGSTLTLRGNAAYYGVYEKNVTLSYNANGGDSSPASDTNICHANVGEEISYDIPTFTVAEGATKRDAIFVGWNTEADGSGTMYQKDGTLELDHDEELYAIFEDNPVFYADFYSGSAGNKETKEAVIDRETETGTVTAPELEPLEGFTVVGWDESPDGFDGETEAGEQLTLTEDEAYYGVYEKDVTLSYDANGGEFCPESDTRVLRANVSQKISYDIPTFTAAAPLPRTGYVFAGWNTDKDGKGEPVDARERLQLDSDTTLYAMWVAGNYTPYRVEHYRQNLEGDGYTRVDADTEYMAGKTGDMVVADVNPYTGFTKNTDPEVGKEEGVVEADGSLVLQVYYDRNIYEVDFDLNGGEGTAPEMQAVRYGGLLQEPEEPVRTGYSFKGWYMDRAGTESEYWDVYRTVEDNTQSQKTTLYARWADETAPVLGEASFGEGYSNFTDWVISQKKLIITVPVTEEGSGLKQGDYSLQPERGEVKAGTALIRVQQAVTPEIRGRSGGLSAVMTIRGSARSGDSVAVITIAEDFKGSVSLTCTDNAGNISVKKILTADGAGAVVEDNAPEIRFSQKKKTAPKGKATLNVDVTDTAGEQISAGIAAISYQVDEGKVKSEGKEEFADAMVEDYSFDVDIEGEGKHTLQVTATDHAGNESIRKATVEISGKKAAIVPNPKTPTSAKTHIKTPTNAPTKTSTELPKPASGEPITGERTFVKIFATLGMVAGFTYLLLYFNSGESGITEDEKEEIISRLVRWAQKGKLRKYPALIIISLFLVYYHSIGKSVSDEWRKVCEG